MNHLKLYEEELSDFTKDLFGLYTTIQLKVFQGDLMLFILLENFKKDFLKLTERMGFPGVFSGSKRKKNLTTNPAEELILYLDFKFDSDFNIDILHQKIKIYDSNEEKNHPAFTILVGQIFRKEKIVKSFELFWNEYLGFYITNKTIINISNYR